MTAKTRAMDAQHKRVLTPRMRAEAKAAEERANGPRKTYYVMPDCRVTCCGFGGLFSIKMPEVSAQPLVGRRLSTKKLTPPADPRYTEDEVPEEEDAPEA